MGDKPISLYDHLSLAKKKIEAGDKKGAEKLFKESTKKYGEDVLSWYNYGVFLERVGKPKDARKAYKKAITSDPFFGSAISNLGLITLQEKGFDAAVGFFKKHAEEHEGHVTVWSNIGGLYYANKMYEFAEKAYRISHKLNPYGSGASSLGRVLHVQDKRDQAKEVIREAYGDQAAERYLRFCDFCQLGFVGFTLPRSPKIEELKQIAEEFPHNHQPWFELGNALISNGDNREAAESFKKCVDAKSDYFEGWANMGAALSKAGIYEEARAAIQQAISLNPSHPAPYENLRKLSEDTGRYSDAIDATMKLLEISSKNDLWVDISRLHLLQDNTDEAFSTFAKGIGEDLKNDKVEDWIKFGKHILSKDPSSAQGCFQKALEIDKEHAETWFYSGYAHLLNGAIPLAQAMFMQALQRDKKYKPTILKLLAERGIQPGILGMLG